ncbi:MAG: cytoplasmic protein [Planctomycetota bacterium]|nr:MAG: cytoplasmic protein [Planctomycetota bacterium]
MLRAHRHCRRHRVEVLRSLTCGCFYCRAIFPPTEILEWTDPREGTGQTAICPHCGVDAVLGTESGYPITDQFLQAMHQHWF